MNASVQLIFSFFFCLEPQSMEWHCPCLGWSLEPQSVYSRNAHTDLPRCLLHGDFKFKWDLKINHHRTT